MLVGNSTSPDTLIRGAQFELSRTCICYLAMEEISQSKDFSPDSMRSDLPLLHYATTSWVAHIKQSDANDVPQDELLGLFAWPSNVLVDLWTRIYRAMDRYSRDCPSEGTTLLHIVARCEILGLLQAILDKEAQTAIDIEAKDEDGWTPLHWAAEYGHEAVVCLLETSWAEAGSNDSGAL